MGRNEREKKKGEERRAKGTRKGFIRRNPLHDEAAGGKETGGGSATTAFGGRGEGKVQEEGEVEIERERVWLLLLLPTDTWDTAGKESFFY